jgi:hypothetical protein
MPVRIWSGGPRSQPIGTLYWPSDSEVAVMPDPMSDDRLDEITMHGCPAELIACDDERDELIAEVGRLRRALRLSEASRGVPSMSSYQTWGGPRPAGQD